MQNSDELPDDHFLAVALHGDGLHVVEEDIVGEVAEGFRVRGIDQQHLVAVAEARVLHLLGEFQTVFGVFERDVVVAPREAHQDVDDDGREEVDEHAANDDEETLPGRFRAELPRVYFAAQVAGFGGLIDHAVDGAVAAEGQPAESPLSGFGMIGPFLGGLSGEEAEVHLPVEAFHPDQRETRVEEDVELVHASLEDFREGEMPELVGDHEERQAGQKAEDLHGNAHY